MQLVVKENELKNTLENIGVKPSLVITDSQVFEKAAKEYAGKYSSYFIQYTDGKI